MPDFGLRWWPHVIEGDSSKLRPLGILDLVHGPRVRTIPLFARLLPFICTKELDQQHRFTPLPGGAVVSIPLLGPAISRDFRCTSIVLSLYLVKRYELRGDW